MEPYYAGFLSLLPPIIAVVLALVTKEVFSSLLIGILTGTCIYSFGMDESMPIIRTVEHTFSLMVDKVDFSIVIFCSLLGSLVYVIAMAGGSRAYGKWASQKIKGKRSSLLATAGLGVFIFIDDYFNCLTVGTVMRPVTDTYKVSRAKLAYIIDATAAPICIIAPISSWAAAVGSNLKSTGVFANEMDAFVATIPWNFYALVSIVMVLLVCLGKFDFGPMRRAEIAASRGEEAHESGSGGSDEMTVHADGGVVDMVIPIISLIIFSTLSLLYCGGYWGDDPVYHNIAAAFGNTDAGPALVLGSFAALLVALIQFTSRKLLDLKTFMQGMLRGVQAMIPANMILVLAWTISGVCRDLLQTQVYISSLVQDDAGLAGMMLPSVIFMIACFLSFSTGTAWGTFGILIPIVVSVAQAIDPESSLTVIALSATLAGSVFGDHCSPISDTTILSSAGSGCIHIEHVATQLPYACLTALCALGGYITAGITQNVFLSLAVAVIMLVCIMSLLHWYNSKRDPDGTAGQKAAA